MLTSEYYCFHFEMNILCIALVRMVKRSAKYEFHQVYKIMLYDFLGLDGQWIFLCKAELVLKQFICNIPPSSQVMEETSSHIPNDWKPFTKNPNNYECSKWLISVFIQVIYIYRHVSFGAAVINKVKKKITCFSSIL